MKQIILASASPRRRKLLESIGLKVKVVPSGIDEKLNPRLKGVSQAEELSRQKADAVAKRYKDALVLAADTLVIVGDEKLGKPKDLLDAKRMLRKLSGVRHSVVTGYTLVDCSSRKIVTKSEETYVYFKKLTDNEIAKYTQKEKVMDKAGAYAIQGYGSILVEKIDGDYSNVVGLPISSVVKQLMRLGVVVL
jgi:septum formation protein